MKIFVFVIDAQLFNLFKGRSISLYVLYSTKKLVLFVPLLLVLDFDDAAHNAFTRNTRFFRINYWSNFEFGYPYITFIIVVFFFLRIFYIFKLSI